MYLDNNDFTEETPGCVSWARCQQLPAHSVELASTSGSVGGIGLLMSMEAKSGWQSTALNHPYFLHNNGVITVPARKYKVK